MDQICEKSEVAPAPQQYLHIPCLTSDASTLQNSGRLHVQNTVSGYSSEQGVTKEETWGCKL